MIRFLFTQKLARAQRAREVSFPCINNSALRLGGSLRDKNASYIYIEMSDGRILWKYSVYA